MADSVLYEVAEGLATVTLNRPEAMNALDTATKNALRDALGAAGADPRYGRCCWPRTGGPSASARTSRSMYGCSPRAVG